MASLKVLSCLFVVSLAAVCHAHKLACAPVSTVSTCPDYLWPLENTIVTNIFNHFDRPTPQDGVCRAGTQKYIFYGKDFGYPENRCVCVTTPPSKFNRCGNGVPACPAMPDAFATEAVGDFFGRVGRELEGGPADGCCRGGDVTWIAEPKYTGARSNLCFCVSQSNLGLQ